MVTLGTGTLVALASQRSGVNLRKARRRLKSHRFFRQTHPGAPAGSVVTDPSAMKPRLRLFSFDCHTVDERELQSVQELLPLVEARRASALSTSTSSSTSSPSSPAQPHGVLWLDVTGLGDAEVIQSIGTMFGLHRLELEDIVNTHQRAKLEAYDDHLYIVMREAWITNDMMDTDQISFVLGHGWLITFQEKPGDSFDPVRQRLRHRKGRLCGLGADALLHALIDSVIDAYFPLLERLGESLETIEETTMEKPSNQIAHSIHNAKRDLLTMRRSVWPAREAVNQLIREDQPLITPETRLYFRDCYDHLVQLIDMLENFREIASALMDIYLASINNRMNEIMKVLTIIATIFMPLSFIAGVCGMNFATAPDGGSKWNMPELHWHFGYLFALAIMALTAGVMLVFFWRKGWIGRRK